MENEIDETTEYADCGSRRFSHESHKISPQSATVNACTLHYLRCEHLSIAKLWFADMVHLLEVYWRNN